MTGSPIEFLLSAAHAAFMQGPVSINVAGRSPTNTPSVMRAYGCSVAPDRRALRLFVYPAHNEELLRHFQDNHVIAAVFSRPSTHETIQLKGTITAIEPVSAGDLEVMQTYRLLLVDELRTIGYASTFTNALLPLATESAATICFTPTQAFMQTPGPTAGQKLTA